MELQSTGRRLRFFEDVFSIRQEQGQPQGPQLCEVKAAHTAIEAGRTPAESYLQ